MTRREWRAQEALRLESAAGGEDEQTVAVTGAAEPVLELGPAAAAATHAPTPAHGVAQVPVHTPGSGLVVDIRDGHVPKARPSIRPGEQGRFVTRGSARPAPPIGEIGHLGGPPVVTGGTPAQPQVLERAVTDDDDDDEVDTMFLASAGVVPAVPALEPTPTQAPVLLRADAPVETSPSRPQIQESAPSSQWAAPRAWDAAQADLAKPVLLPPGQEAPLATSSAGAVGLPPPPGISPDADSPVGDALVGDSLGGSSRPGHSLESAPISDEPLIPAVSRSTDSQVSQLPPPVGEVPVATGFHTSTDTGSRDYSSTSDSGGSTPTNSSLTSSSQAATGQPLAGQNAADRAVDGQSETPSWSVPAAQTGGNSVPVGGYTGTPQVLEPRLASLAVGDDDETAVIGESGAPTDAHMPTDAQVPAGSLPRAEGSLHDFADATERRLRAERRELMNEDSGVQVGDYQPVALKPHWAARVAGLLAGLAVLCIAGAVFAPGGSLWLRLVLAVVALVCVVFACRLPFIRVFLAPDALHAHGLWSSVTVFRVGVVRAMSVDDSTTPLGARALPQVRLANNETLKLVMLSEMKAGPLSFGSHPARVKEHVDEINAWLIARGHTEAIAVVGKR